MNTKDVEVRLERSLRKRVSLPALDARFNAAVWERIAAESVPASVSTASASRGFNWLLASNVIGIAVSLALIAYFVVREAMGIRVDFGVALPALPALPEHATASIFKSLGWGVTAAAVGFGFAFTRVGRRLLAFFRAQFA
jgi:hypothetical protein